MKTMEKKFSEAVVARRSYYSIEATSPVDDAQIVELLRFAALNTPSAFNSQSTRLVLLLADNHRALWDIVLETLSKIVPEQALASTQAKIASFAAGYGTVLFFEDQAVVESLQAKFALYADNFPVWSNHTSAMHQFVVWTMLEDLGFGASLQHYNPLIDSAVCERWGLSAQWKLVAQMPFGTPTANPGPKTHEPIDDRVLVF